MTHGLPFKSSKGLLQKDEDFTYLLLDRPIAYVQDDKDEFDSKRGFCFKNIDEMSPGDKIKCKDDFTKFIEKMYNNIDEYKTDRKKVRDFYHKYQDGNSSKILSDYFEL